MIDADLLFCLGGSVYPRRVGRYIGRDGWVGIGLGIARSHAKLADLFG